MLMSRKVAQGVDADQFKPGQTVTEINDRSSFKFLAAENFSFKELTLYRATQNCLFVLLVINNVDVVEHVELKITKIQCK
jgi:hypothetical protein